MSIASTGVFEVAALSGEKIIGSLSGDVGSLITLNGNNFFVNEKLGDSTIFAGSINGGAASLTKTGAGTLALSGVNTYNGGTSINTGILKVSGVGTLGVTTSLLSISGTGQFELDRPALTIGGLDNGGGSGINLNGNALTVTQSVVRTFEGPIFGTGSFIKSGASTLILSGFNTYSGGTTVSSGILQGTTSSLQGAITNNAQVTFDQAGTGTYSGVMSGTGSLVKSGAGNLIMSGANTYFGATSVNAGTLTVDGSIANSIVSVNSGATLRGIGTFGAPTFVNGGGTLLGTGNFSKITVENGGVVNPGNSIGIITVSGSYILNDGSVQVINIEGFTSDQVFAGAATIANNAILKIPFFEASLPEGTTYDILVAPGGINQEWQVVDGAPEFKFSLALVEFGTIVRLTVIEKVLFFGKLINPGNATSVYDYLQCVNIRLDSDLANVISVMGTLNDIQLNRALVLLGPSLFGALDLVNLDNNAQMTSILSNQVHSLSGLDKRGKGGGSLFLTPFGNFINVDKYQDVSGFKTVSGGVMTGMNCAFKTGIFLGFGGGYENTALDWNRGGVNWRDSIGDASINTLFGAFYGGVNIGRTLIDASVITGVNYYDVVRKVQFSSIDRSAKNNHRGYFATTHLGADMDLSLKWMKFELFGLCDYSYLYQGGYSEKGADSLNLSVDTNKSHFLRSEAGVRVAKDVRYKYFSIRPYGALSWVFKTPFGNTQYTSRFVDSETEPCTLKVNTFRASRSFFAPEFGAYYKCGRYTFSLNYRAEIGGGYTMNQFRGEMQWFF
ncbi:autotransporter domain-containing protein, partial [Chlamydiales bacterium]|nr:autotransporter domain-containing protein [Chlamydiales bacterium]